MSTEKVYYQRTFKKFFMDNEAYPKGQYCIEAICRVASLGGQSPYFSATADIWPVKYSKDDYGSFGMQHDAIAKHFPELEKFLKWHLVSIEQPMHYLANSLYWAGFCGYCDGKPSSPPNIEYLKSTCIYGAIESDQNFDLDRYAHLTIFTGDNPDFHAVEIKAGMQQEKEKLNNWLVERLPALMDQFDNEMKVLFPDYERV
jgi:hypothetical protein